MLRSILAIAAGYVAACLAAGATQVLFVVEPASIFSTREAAAAAGLLTAIAAIQAGTFALPFAVLMIAIAEILGLRGWLTYAVAAALIALCGYGTVIMGEEPGSTLRNDVALRAFVISGVIGGVVFWFVAGALRLKRTT